ncbi:hypothetical protein [Moraxella bovoculi]|nr:hypothetical protein [Moraxella bovoculi]
MNESDYMDFIDSQFSEQEQAQIEYDDAWALRDYLAGFDQDELPFGVLA